MRMTVLIGIIVVLMAAACRDKTRNAIEQEPSSTTTNIETGLKAPLPPDVLYATKSLISGQLYTSPKFQSATLTSFDTSQYVYVLDTSHAIFVHARIKKDGNTLTGYIPKTILPEKRKE